MTQNQLPRNPNAFARITAQLGSGIRRFLLIILMLPLLLFGLIFMQIIKWKIKKQMKKMAKAMQDGDFSDFVQPGTEMPAQKIKVKVYDSETES